MQFPEDHSQFNPDQLNPHYDITLSIDEANKLYRLLTDHEFRTGNDNNEQPNALQVPTIVAPTEGYVSTSLSDLYRNIGQFQLIARAAAREAAERG